MQRLFYSGLIAACALLATATVVMAQDAAAPAAALDEATAKDLHCFMIYTQMGSRVKDDSLRMAMALGSAYFMGKIDGRNTNFDLESAVMAEFPKLTGAAYGGEMERCSNELQTRGETERAMGLDLQQKALQMRQEQNSR